MLMNNDGFLKKIEYELPDMTETVKNEMIISPFYEDFTRRFCWNSNSIEGNTLSFDETISLLDYDEVRSGHTYTEYSEAKQLFQAIKKMLKFNRQNIDETWIQEANGLILGREGGYRKTNLYVGTLVEAVYYPPKHEEVPRHMTKYVEKLNQYFSQVKEVAENIAREHLEFERIHPFPDGNGRCGRLIMNQRLINNGWLPITIEDQSKYRQAFRRYDRSQDTSLLVYVICKGELASIERVKELERKLERTMAETRSH